MRAFMWFLGLVALGLAAIALLTYPAWLLLHPHFDFPFHRIGERIGMLALLGGFLAVAPRLQLADRASLGFGLARRAFLAEFGLAAMIGTVTMLSVVAIMSALGLLDWTALRSASGGTLAKLIVLRALSALTVALIEETFLRGAMHTAIARQSGPRAAVLLTALLYAATHFFASYHIDAPQVTPWSGLVLLAGTLHAFAAPFSILDAFLALFAVGVVLGGVRVATGNIAACMGLHAGWVWVMLVAHAASTPRNDAPLKFLLSRFDGFVGWLVFAATLAMALPLWRFYRAWPRGTAEPAKPTRLAGG
jgi:membrane protease YdiL (CAAX protease family)